MVQKPAEAGEDFVSSVATLANLPASEYRSVRCSLSLLYDVV